MKRLIVFVILLQALISFTFANELIVISGGPALRYYERHKAVSHDKFWGNFINAAEIKIKKLKSALKEGDTIVWMVYRPGYESRSKEEETNLITDITKRAENLGVNLVWFDNRAEFVQYLNANRDDDHNKIARLEYFGHSNKRNWMFDYSNQLDGGCIELAMFHIWNFHELDRGIFTDDVVCKSWGCHSGEQYSSAWYKYTGKRMIGAVGKTDYSNGELPILSTEDGKWTQ